MIKNKFFLLAFLTAAFSASDASSVASDDAGPSENIERHHLSVKAKLPKNLEMDHQSLIHQQFDKNRSDDVMALGGKSAFLLKRGLEALHNILDSKGHLTDKENAYRAQLDDLIQESYPLEAFFKKRDAFIDIKKQLKQLNREHQFSSGEHQEDLRLKIETLKKRMKHFDQENPALDQFLLKTIDAILDGKKFAITKNKVGDIMRAGKYF